MSGNDEPSQTQHDRFVQAARQLGADEEEVADKDKLAQIARQKLKPPAQPSETVGWYVRITTDQVYDEVYNTVLYIAGFPSPAEAAKAVREIRLVPDESYEVLSDPITADRGPQPEPGEVRLLLGAV